MRLDVSGKRAKVRAVVATVAFFSMLASSVNVCFAEKSTDPTASTKVSTKKQSTETSRGSEKAQSNSKSDSKAKDGLTPIDKVLCDEEKLPTNPQLRQNEAIDHMQCARFYMSQWDTALAEVELRAAIMYMPDMRAAHRDYCLVAILRGKPLRAIAEFMMVVGLGEAIPLTESQQKELREEASGLHYNKGLEYAKKDDWQEAISELLWSEKYTPLDPAVHRSLAFSYASNNEFDRAEQYYNFALSLNPDDAMALADYAAVLSENGNADKAMQKMARAVNLKPNTVALHVDLGWIAESKGDYKTAAKEFQYAVSKNPKHPVLWAHLGKSLNRLGKIGDAKKAYENALKIDPGYTEAKDELKSIKGDDPAVTPATTPKMTPVPASTEPKMTPFTK